MNPDASNATDPASAGSPESRPVPTVEVRGKDHTISRVNDAFCQLLGRPKGELIGHSFRAVMPAGEEFAPLLDEVSETGRSKGYAHIDQSQPSTFWLYVICPAVDRAGRKAGVIVELTRARKIHDDSSALREALLVAGLRQHELRESAEALNARLENEITARKQTEVELCETLRDLQSAHWNLEQASLAKDNFLAALSHELRTPITPVLLTAEALAGDPSLPADVREQVALMHRNVQIQARLIDDLLDMARITHGKFKMHRSACDLHEIVFRATEMVRAEHPGKKVKLSFRLDAPQRHILADATRMQQVFWNLLRNALKFTPDGGSVTVSSANDPADAIVVEVQDTGIGIPSEAVPFVFDAFKQGKVAGERYGGLGLGLAISHAIVQAHGGVILAASTGEGMGAKFTVALPSCPAPEPGPAAARAAQPLTRSLQLLIVEDHDATREVLARLLGKRGHRVATASCIHDALAAFKGARFDAVISDLGLPDGSGLELIRKLHEVRHVPAIALSGYGMEEDLRRTAEAGFAAHLVKPVNLEDLRHILDKIAAAP